MQGITDILGSARGLFALLLLVTGGVLTGMGKMTVTEWQTYSLWALGIFTGGKSLEGAAGALKSGHAVKPGKEAKPPAPPA